MTQSLGWLLAGLLVVYLGITLGMYVFQRKLIYRPDVERSLLSEADLPQASEVVLRTEDHLELNAWYIPPPQPDRPVLLYLHGNAGTLADRAARLRHFIAAGFGCLLVDYRGFGGNPGSPTEAGLFLDGLAGLNWLRAEGIRENRIVVYGESLGTAVAVKLASESRVAGVVLDAPLTSVTDVAAGHYPWLPVRWLVKDRFDSLSRISQVVSPVLVMHGTIDGVVPYALGERLFAAANEPKEFVRFDGGSHMDLYDFGAAAAVAGFVERYAGRQTIRQD
ncbi:MAG: alpha/beta hydrolase [Rhodospirillales bacterium]